LSVRRKEGRNIFVTNSDEKHKFGTQTYSKPRSSGTKKSATGKSQGRRSTQNWTTPSPEGQRGDVYERGELLRKPQKGLDRGSSIKTSARTSSSGKRKGKEREGGPPTPEELVRACVN